MTAEVFHSGSPSRTLRSSGSDPPDYGRSVVDQTPVLVVGAGGHALVSIEVLRESGHVVRGCVASRVGAVEGLRGLDGLRPDLGQDFHGANVVVGRFHQFDQLGN